jgi:hypothetical protein
MTETATEREGHNDGIAVAYSDWFISLVIYAAS